MPKMVNIFRGDELACNCFWFGINSKNVALAFQMIAAAGESSAMIL